MMNPDFIRKYKNLSKHFDLTSISPFTIGFESILQNLEDGFTCSTYPPFNLNKKDGHWEIELAVAGFELEELSIELEDNSMLTIKGLKKTEENLMDPSVIFKGIANRAFTKKFTLGEGVKVTNSTLKNGILKITLEKEDVSPKVKKINIETTDTKKSEKEFLVE